jgi:four helix bundle protein
MIERFKRLWQSHLKNLRFIKKIQLAKFVFKLLENKAFEKRIWFSKPNKRTVISITNNIAEGSEYNSNKQLIKFKI